MSCANCTFGAGLRKSPNNSDVTVTSCNKFDTYDWLNDLPDTSRYSDIVEVRFKNTRKEFFKKTNGLKLQRGDIIVVEAPSGHDVGTVSLTGKLAELQYKRKNREGSYFALRNIYRKATQNDIQKWESARSREFSTMIIARKIAGSLGLEMKVSDVEFQGDNTKATFYYIAERRVDFRELIKLYAEAFKIKIEMKQIGARQEAGLIGGIGSCGRELCCSSWKTNLETVPLSAPKYQELPVNLQYLTGKCGKLKCCLMYELDNYIESRKDFPDVLLELETLKGTAYKYKIDVLKKIVWYSYDPGFSSALVPVNVERIKEIIMMNKKGIKPDDL
ncbi:MAG: hypothetical protein JXB00_16135 [Bacteroidales bacterium]|nr:hypothetical protein [Bacteroidales bacterium]